MRVVTRPERPETFPRTEGRVVFGTVAGIYADARPGYPARVEEILKVRCGLGPPTRVLEIGPGSGQATAFLLESGASVVAVEPNDALAVELGARMRTGADRLEVIVDTFEDAQLPSASFDLVVAASAFHWVEQETGVARAFDALRPGGWLALWWNNFGDPDAPDAFYHATDPLLRNLDNSPSAGEPDRPPFALDAPARMTSLERHGFAEIEHEVVRWRVALDAARVRLLFSTFAPIARLPEQERDGILDELERIAAQDFGGRIERTILTPIYTAARPR